MRVDVQYRQLTDSIWLKRGRIWLKRGRISYGANWHCKGPVRKRALLKAMMRDTVRFGAPWLWDKKERVD